MCYETKWNLNSRPPAEIFSIELLPVPEVPLPGQEQELPPVARQPQAPGNAGTQLRPLRRLPERLRLRSVHSQSKPDDICAMGIRGRTVIVVRYTC